MFTEQIGELVAALRGELSEQALLAIEQFFGSCMSTLSHRGTVNLPGLTLRQNSPQGQRADEVQHPEFSVVPVGVTGPPGTDRDWLYFLFIHDIVFICGPGPPIDGNGGGGTGYGFAGTGSLYIDLTTGNWYKNIGDKKVPVWSELEQVTLTT